MADKITRCPQCATAFRISDAHLKSAKGTVRCGACLHVFNALEHMEIPTASADSERPPIEATDAFSTETSWANEQREPNVPVTEPPTQSTRATEIRPDSAPSSSTSSDIKQSPGDTPSEPSLKSSTFYSQQTASGTDAADDDDPSAEDDEAWALALLAEDESEPAITLKKVVYKDPAVEPENTPEQASENDGFEPYPDQEADNFDDPLLNAELSSESEAEGDIDADTLRELDSALEEVDAVNGAATEDEADDDTTTLAPEPEPTRSDTAATELAATPVETQPAAVIDDADAKAPSDQTGEPLASPIAQEQGTATSTARANTAEQDSPLADKKTVQAMIAAIEPDALEVDWQGQRLPWYRRALWLILVMVAAFVLLTQIAWLEFDRLSRIEPYRTLYSVACRALPCQLPELRDLGQINTTNLVVRSHPELQDVLVVDVILQNQAHYPQPFPSLQLTFSDLNDAPVAVRTFTPQEYLGGEMAGQDIMPSRQPIHIGMEIVDPGPQAVSYRIAVVDSDKADLAN